MRPWRVRPGVRRKPAIGRLNRWSAVCGEAVYGGLGVVGGGQAVAAGGFGPGVSHELGDQDEVVAAAETGRERITNHAEYLSRSGAPGGYSRGWWLPVRICPAVSQVQARSVCRSAAAMRGGPVRGAPARRRAAWLTGELAAARTSVFGGGMHHVQPERLVARSGAWRDQ
jgi:hypothetical protein